MEPEKDEKVIIKVYNKPTPIIGTSETKDSVCHEYKIKLSQTIYKLKLKISHEGFKEPKWN